MDFDPETVSYEHLLELFWASHDATRAAFKTQYASLILTSNEAQLAAARESAAQMGQLYGKAVATRIEPLGTFWMAEAYHQKYYLRNDRVLMADLHSYYPDDAAFVDSTVAARANGLLAAGTCDRVERELPKLGLSGEGASRLRAHCR